MKKPKFQAPTGMHDILGEDQFYFQRIYDVASSIADFYGFSKIDTPILEETELFSKGIGAATDIVQKEMYNLRTKGGDHLSLRPEWTAPIARAYIENGLYVFPQPIKLWYFGPCFRYERPQAGRYRQFWQFGFEVIGEKDPVIDAQIIQIFYNILNELRLKDLNIEVNNIGDSQCRPYYKKLLSSYFRSRESSLCVNCKRRLKENVLRILDCKEIRCQFLKEGAPQILDHLCEECRCHFREVLEFLDEIDISYQLNPYLVRGLDYYTKTVFEIYSQVELERGNGEEENRKEENRKEENRKEEEEEESKELSSLALVAGGRYDKLVKFLGGKDTPGCGAAAGLERIISLMKKQGIELTKSGKSQVFLAQLGSLAKRKSLKLLDDFRKAKIRVSELFGRDSLKAQLARADRVGAKYALILGQQEALEGNIIIRDMKNGKQDVVKLEKVVKEVKKRLKNKPN